MGSGDFDVGLVDPLDDAEDEGARAGAEGGAEAEAEAEADEGSEGSGSQDGGGAAEAAALTDDDWGEGGGGGGEGASVGLLRQRVSTLEGEVGSLVRENAKLKRRLADIAALANGASRSTKAPVL